MINFERNLDLVNKVISEMKKGVEPSILYQMSEDGLNSELLWDRCKAHHETITFIKTDLDTIIGFYCPDKLRDTTNFKDSTGNPGWIDIS